MHTAALRIAQRRLPAAQAAIAIAMQQASRRSRLRLILRRSHIDITSVNRAAEAFGRAAHGGRDTNWIRDAWSPSRRVLHLAIALHSTLQQRPRGDIWTLIDHPEWARSTIEVAEKVRLTRSSFRFECG